MYTENIKITCLFKLSVSQLGAESGTSVWAIQILFPKIFNKVLPKVLDICITYRQNQHGL